MNEELTRYYETLQDRENDGQRVYFDLYAISNNGGNIISTPLVTVANAGKNASGADVFKRNAEKATSRKYDALQIKEYSRINGDVTSEATIQISTTKGKRSYSPAKKLSGNTALGDLGYSDLGAFIEEKAGSQLLGFRVSELTNQLNSANNKIESLESELKGLKNENEKLKYDNRDLQYENKSIQRDAESKNAFGTLAINGVLNYLGTKAGITSEQLQGLLGIVPDTDTDDDPEPANVGSAPSKKSESEEDRIINKIVNKLYDFDTADSLNRILAIVELCAKSPKNLADIFGFSKRLYKSLKGSNASLDIDDDNEDFSGEEDGDDE
ncbi:MAG: hypothetical protein IKP73_01105 [Bacteroidales bacterium]|nr:hypothetical protein [Bacteroidales bacterium]